MTKKLLSSKNWYIVISLLVISALGIVWLQKHGPPKPQNHQLDALRITSTKPDPLENATVLPDQTIEVTFSRPVEVGRLKFRLDPELPLEAKSADGELTGKTVIISLKKPLQFGSGYTLFIFPDPANKEKLPLDKDYIYHFKTIGYRGI